MPTQWAETQSYLAETLKLLGEREGNMSRLQEARAAIVDALEVDPDRANRHETLKQIDAAIARPSPHTAPG
jgi:hypothetical protein